VDEIRVATPDWAVVAAVAGQIITWVGVIVLHSITLGKMINRVETTEKEVDEIKRLVRDPDHKILTEDTHAVICNHQQQMTKQNNESQAEIILLQFKHLCKKLEEVKTTDQEVFARITSIESNIAEIKTELRVKQVKDELHQ